MEPCRSHNPIPARHPTNDVSLRLSQWWGWRDSRTSWVAGRAAISCTGCTPSARAAAESIVHQCTHAYLHQHPHHQLDSKIHGDFDSGEHAEHVVGAEEDVEREEELQRGEDDDLTGREGRSLAQLQGTDDLRRPEGVDEEDEVVGKSVLRIHRHQSDDDEQVQTEEQTRQFALVLLVVRGVYVRVVRLPHDEHQSHLHDRKYEEFVE